MIVLDRTRLIGLLSWPYTKNSTISGAIFVFYGKILFFLYALHDYAEGLRVFDGNVGKDFAIKLDTSSF